MAQETLAELVVKIETDAKEMKKGLTETEKAVEETGKTIEKETKSMSQSISDLGKYFAGLGATITAVAGISLKKYSDLGTEIYESSKKTGIASESLSEWKYVLEQNGASIGSFINAMKQMSSALVDASSGSKESVKSFEMLGLSVDDLRKLSPEKQFETIAYSLSDMQDATLKSALAQNIFGRSSQDLLPTLSEGRDKIATLRQEAHDLGVVFSEEAARKADEFGDSMTKLQESVNGLKVAIGEQLGPTIKNYADLMSGSIKGVQDWSKANPELSNGLVNVGMQLGVWSTALGGLSFMLPKITGMITNLFGSLGKGTGILAGLTVGFSMISWGLTTIFNQRRQQAEVLEANMKLEEAYTKALNGEHGEYVKLLEDYKAQGYRLSENADTYINSYNKAVEEATLANKANIESLKAQAEAIKKSHEALKNYIDFMGWSRGIPQEYFTDLYGPEWALPAGARTMPLYETEFPFPTFQHGGLVTKPTIGLIGEGGPEMVIPVNEGYGTVVNNVNFTEPVFFDREDTMNRFITKIQSAIDRQYRLRFGSGYHG